jgi:hypothetical protein
MVLNSSAQAANVWLNNNADNRNGDTLGSSRFTATATGPVTVNK